MSESAKFDYTKFDKLIDPNGPVMIAAQQFLKITAISSDDIVFPPSYANPSEKKDDPPVYNIDIVDPADPSKNVCVLDSVPSQANRMEPLFGLPKYLALVPQYSVKLTEDSPPISILEVGHRLADAVFRGTALRDPIVQAFKNYSRGNAAPLARLGATSLVFGVWDSRGTGVKVPRLINSIVRAFNVTQLKRSAQYSPPIKYEQEGLIPAGLEGKPADHGLADVPSSHKIGGVQIHGDIRRDFSLNLSTLRALKGANADETEKLQRYILSLALLAFTATPESTLRQGCQLLPKGKPTWKQFFATGDESDWVPDSLNIADFAAAAASDFGVVQPQNQPLVFDKKLLKTSIDADAKKKADKKASNKSPIDNLTQLVNALKSSNKGKKLNDRKLSEYLQNAEGDELKPLANQMIAVLDGVDGPEAKIQKLKEILPSPADGPTVDESDEVKDDSEGDSE
ncbi:MAG: type I-U CRISPR-associated RAMP protein Csb1/Cas7u [Planctomycetaceae bacterium]